ncbi:F-box protein At5g03100-like [Silene latifolia]|uniref:F-box protein At5g03100-like n=1 Tax=Silene latifolia TaxID=37657 RepID=UPI003D7744B7
MWLRFALDKQAKEIVFDGVSYEYSDSSDFQNFTSQSLVTLELRYCIIFPQLQVNLGSLKKLIFNRTDMCEEAFEQFICGCPSLEELCIVEPYSISNLRFSAPNIRKLSLVLTEDEPSNATWLFDFPNLKTLELEIVRIPEVIDVSSVLDVYLKWLYVDEYDEDELRMFDIFLEKFSHCEVFQLSLDASEPFFHAIDDLHLLQIRWKCVVLGLRIFCQSCLLGFYQLMRSTKHLEELTIVRHYFDL